MTARTFKSKTESKSSQWLGTHNTPTSDMIPRDYLEKWFTAGKARYVNGQLEKGKEGTVHIQFYLNFENPVRLSALKKHDSRAHFEPVKRDNGASDYCLKEDTRLEGPWEFGVKPARKNVRGETAERNARILEIGPEKCVNEGLIHIKEYLKLKQCVDAYKINTTDIKDSEDVRGEWYWGQPGTGKSMTARQRYPGSYLKAQNKWWDGYSGQKSVILDDLDSDCLAHYLKIWADRYACTGEIKGSTIPLNFDKLVVTSNYHPAQLFKDEQMTAAIIRRFKITEFK